MLAVLEDALRCLRTHEDVERVEPRIEQPACMH
jgi:hypothetical protein